MYMAIIEKKSLEWQKKNNVEKGSSIFFITHTAVIINIYVQLTFTTTHLQHSLYSKLYCFLLPLLPPLLLPLPPLPQLPLLLPPM